MGWLVDLLEELELEPHLVHPSRCKAIASASCRNDKVDAATLAQLLRADLLPEAWIAPQATRDLRAVLGHRASLVRMGTACKNRMHAVLADRGIPDHASLWTGPGRAWLVDLELPATHAGSSRTAVGCWMPWPPRSPGWNARSPGWPTRPTGPGAHGPARRRPADRHDLVAEIGDIARFPTARKLCAWAGLTPQVRNSDRKVRHGHITKQGSPWVRGILGGGRPDGQAPPHARQHLRPAGPPSGHPHRHHRDRPAAAGPLLPHPHPARDTTSTGEGQDRARSRFRMSRQHGRLC